MSKVLLTLDFDGAVSPIANDYDFKNDSSYRVFTIGAFPCAVAQTTLDFLQELKAFTIANPELLQVVWASTWLDQTAWFTEDSQGAIPQFDYLNVKSHSKSEAVAKEALSQQAELVVMIEDSASVKGRTYEFWKQQIMLKDVELLFVHTPLKEGLRASDIATIREALTTVLGKAF